MCRLDAWGWVHIRQVMRAPKKMHGHIDRQPGGWVRPGVCQPSPWYIYALRNIDGRASVWATWVCAGLYATYDTRYARVMVKRPRIETGRCEECR